MSICSPGVRANQLNNDIGRYLCIGSHEMKYVPLCPHIGWRAIRSSNRFVILILGLIGVMLIGGIMGIAIAVSHSERNPELLEQTAVVIGGSAGTLQIDEAHWPA